MKSFNRLTFLLLMLGTSVIAVPQVKDWRSLAPLSSTREEVERILGKPSKHFDSYGLYKTPEGTFSVWYSTGGCQKNIEGVQYDVPANKLVSIYFKPSAARPLEFYVSDKNALTREESPLGFNRIRYTTPDGSMAYETIPRSSSNEFVYSIDVGAGRSIDRLLCKPLQ